jgi:adenylosuccinate synthase
MDNLINKFLAVVKQFGGANPEFSIDYKKEQIVLKDAPSGFLKLLYYDDNVCAHLTREGIKITYHS